MKVQLVVVQGKPEGMTIPLATPRYKIGRGEGCQLRPNSDLVSREHAEFLVTADSVVLQDLGSRNGTEVNGKKLPAKQPVKLKSGDLIKVGTLTFAISIEGLPVTKPVPVMAGGNRKSSLDDVSGDEIDAWLVSDESRPTPDRPSQVYGGDTITLATYKGQEKPKAATPPPQSAPAAAAKPMPAPATPAPQAAPAPIPTPVAVAPIPQPTPVAASVAAPAAVPSPPAFAPAATPPPAPSPAPVPPPVTPAVAAETPGINPLFDFLPDDLPQNDAVVENEEESFEEIAEDDGIEDLAALQAAEEAEQTEPTMPEEFVDESNPFYVKKKPTETSAVPSKSAASSQDSSAAAGDILRKLLDRRRTSKS